MSNELLKTARSVALVLPKTLSDEVVGAALALFLFFKKEKRSAAVFSETPLPLQWKCLNLTPLTIRPSESTEHAIIIDTGVFPTEEIRYEKDEKKNQLRIILTTSEPVVLNKESLAVEPMLLSFDSVVTVGAKNIAAVGAVWKDHPELFYEKPIIPVYPETDEETISEKAVALMKNLSPHPYTPDIATALLFSLFAETASLKKTAPSSSTTRFASELIARDADHRAVAGALVEGLPLGVLQLWGRACVRSKMDGALPVFWSVLTAEDFTKTNTSADALSSVMRHMEQHASLPATSVFLWQHPTLKTIRSAIISKSRTLGERIKTNAEYPSFPAAEEHIRTLLETILRNETS